MKILLFTASFCGPCGRMKVLAEFISQAYQTVKYEAVDCEEKLELVEKYRVASVPTLMLVNDSGEEVRRLVGGQSQETVLTMFNEAKG